jgi:hypothetical protein
MWATSMDAFKKGVTGSKMSKMESANCIKLDFKTVKMKKSSW